MKLVIKYANLTPAPTAREVPVPLGTPNRVSLRPTGGENRLEEIDKFKNTRVRCDVCGEDLRLEDIDKNAKKSRGNWRKKIKFFMNS